MMASEEKPTDALSKMEESVTKEVKQEKDVEQEAQKEIITEEEPESKMETEETQMEDSPKVVKEVTMETELTTPQIIDHDKEMDGTKTDENTLKDDKDAPVKDEEKLVSIENKVQDNKAEEKTEVVQEKDNTGIADDKMEEATSNTSDQVTVEPEKVTPGIEEDWDVLGTDDEKESGDKKTSGVWMPSVNVIIDLYQKLDKEGVLELQWKCPGRRPPPEEVDEKKEDTEKTEAETEKPEVEEEKHEEEPTEFDFDVDTPSVTSMAPRRTPGSGQALGSGKKRVARMDKIFNDMLRHKKIDEELARVGDESDEAANRTDTTPQRPLGKFRIRKDF